MAPSRKKVELLNASYDIARELFVDINPAFQAQWKAKTGDTLTIRQSHGGSSKQARSVAEGLPKKVRDWADLARPGIQVVFPNPKTSGNGRYTYLGAYAYALEKNKGDAAKVRTFIAALLANVPVFDTGGRGATTTFVERGIGDVLVTFEAEVSSIRREYAKSALETVMPSISVRADFPVAVVDKVVARHRTQEVAKAYLQFLYSEAGQEILAKHFNRVNDPKVAERYKTQFAPVRLVTGEEAFGGWDAAMKVHFADGGVLDQALAARR